MEGPAVNNIPHRRRLRVKVTIARRKTFPRRSYFQRTSSEHVLSSPTTSYQHVEVPQGTSLDNRTSHEDSGKNSQVSQGTSFDDRISQEESVKNSQVPQGTSLDPGTSQQESVIDVEETQPYESKFSLFFSSCTHITISLRIF
jgi:hypothetical protein